MPARLPIHRAVVGMGIFWNITLCSLLKVDPLWTMWHYVTEDRILHITNWSLTHHSVYIMDHSSWQQYEVTDLTWDHFETSYKVVALSLWWGIDLLTLSIWVYVRLFKHFTMPFSHFWFLFWNVCYFNDVILYVRAYVLVNFLLQNGRIS
jgi:hypothetical protein